MWRIFGIKHDTNLTRIPTDRLLQEYAKLADAGATLKYLSERSEFGTKEHPVTIDAQQFSGSVFGVLLRQRIAEELKRRGVPVPSE